MATATSRVQAAARRGPRLRFAPSPTGSPHVGLMRTALSNFVHARHTRGTLVFRIEDTDAARDSEDSYRELVHTMRWFGIDWDEGVEVGGPYGPYRQSERRELYTEVLAALVARGDVYESYTTPDEVEARHRAAGRDPKLGYDNHDRLLTDAARAALRAEGRRPVYRFRMPDDDVTFHDAVRGEVTFRAGSTPDFVVARAAGDPLYTLTNPIDDATMRIDLVLRGEDLLASTPRQIPLHRALIELGYAERVPEFGHLPYVMGEGNKKLSKRDPASSIRAMVEAGFVAEGLVNYLMLQGWSIGPDHDVFSLDEAIEAFDVHDVHPSPARFDLTKATSINGDHIRMLAPPDLAARLVPVLQRAGLLADPPDASALELLAAAVPLVQTRMALLGEAPGLLGFLFVDPEAFEVDPADAARSLETADGQRVLAAAAEALDALPEDQWGHEVIEQALRAALIEDLGLKPRVAFGPVRVALTGSRISPPLFESIELLGRPETRRRLGAVLSASGGA